MNRFGCGTADRAGPFAHKAGDAAAGASVKIASRSRELAEELRRELASRASTDAPSSAESDASSTATAVMDRPAEDVVPEANPPENEPG